MILERELKPMENKKCEYCYLQKRLIEEAGFMLKETHLCRRHKDQLFDELGAAFSAAEAQPDGRKALSAEEVKP